MRRQRTTSSQNSARKSRNPRRCQRVACALGSAEQSVNGEKHHTDPIQLNGIRSDADWNRFQQSKVRQSSMGWLNCYSSVSSANGSVAYVCQVDDKQRSLVESLEPLSKNATDDALVVGVGPAGLSLAAELASEGLKVGLVGPDTPFVNIYGVWVDEFQELGLEDA